MIKWIINNKKSIIRAAFLIPILAVSAVSISHVVSWYDLANPISWAIYLSIAVELAAMSSIAAASAKVKGFSVWIVFLIVTLIQLVGNIYFSYSEIDVLSKSFKDWSELTKPVFDLISPDSAEVGQRRLLALLQGGLLPLISLTCLHFFIQYGESEEPVKEEEAIIEESKELDTVPDTELLEQIELESFLDVAHDLDDEVYENNDSEIEEVIQDDSEYFENEGLVDLVPIPQAVDDIEVSMDDLPLQTIPGDGANIQFVKPVKKAPRLYLDDDKK